MTSNPSTTAPTKGQEFIKDLRAATASLHQDLEELPLSKSLMSEDVTLTQYMFYLSCMKDVIAFYDHVILPFIKDVIEDEESRKRLSGISQDLSYLKTQGITCNETVPFEFPTVASPAFAMGLGYVIEGSTLGGRIILKHIQPKLQVTEASGAVFFAGYGAETGTMWKSFLNKLMHFAVQDNEEEVIAGAIAGFKSIGEHFQRNSSVETD